MSKNRLGEEDKTANYSSRVDVIFPLLPQIGYFLCVWFAAPSCFIEETASI